MEALLHDEAPKEEPNTSNTNVNGIEDAEPGTRDISGSGPGSTSKMAVSGRELWGQGLGMLRSVAQKTAGKHIAHKIVISHSTM